MTVGMTYALVGLLLAGLFVAMLTIRIVDGIIDRLDKRDGE